MGGGSRTVTQSSTTAPPSWMQDMQRQYLARAQEISDRPYQAYTGQLVQGLTGDQTQARQMLRDRIASGGSQQFRQGRDALNDIIGGGSYADPGTTRYDPTLNRFLGQSVGVGRNSYLGRETEVARNRFLDEKNPFLDETVNYATGDVTRAFNQQQAPAQLAQFALGGAFGGTAHLQAMGESQRALAQELGRVSTTIRGDDFNARRQLAESEAERITGTRLADINRNAGIEQDTMGLQAQMAQADLSRNAQLMQDGLQFGANLSERNLDRRQNAQQFAQSQRLQALGLLPGFEDAGIRDIQALNNMGAEERDYLQQLLSANYGQFIDARDWDARQLGLYGNAIGSVAPSYQNTTGTSPNPNYQSRGQQALGIAMTAASLGI